MTNAPRPQTDDSEKTPVPMTEKPCPVRNVRNDDVSLRITPGEILLKEYLEPMEISQNAMARAIGVSTMAINEIVIGRRSITHAMSIRFGEFFAQSDEFWYGIQVECDFRKLAGDKHKLVSGIQPASTLTRNS